MDLWQEAAFLHWVEAMDDFVFTTDPAGRVTGSYCPPDKRFPNLSDDFIGHPFKEIFPEEIAQAFQIAIESLNHLGLTQKVKFQLFIKGIRRHFAAKIGRLQPSGYLVVIWDVTDDVLSHQAHLDSETIYRLLAENSSDVVSIKYMDDTFGYLSPSVEKLSGYSPQSLMGKRVLNILHPDDVAKAYSLSPTSDFNPPPEGARFRHRIRHKDGRWIWVETEARVIEWRGQPAVLTSTHDIMIQHESEKKTAELLEKLKEARNTAEAANSAKSEFLINMSHELRTPLHGILGMAELLEQTHQTEDQQQYLTALQDSGNVLLALLNDLQDLSQIEAGHLNLQVTPFDLVEAVEGLTDILDKQAAERRIELTCHVANSVPARVTGDPHRLRQILINLISSSFKRCPGGYVEVTVARGTDDRQHFEVREIGDEIQASCRENPLMENPLILGGEANPLFKKSSLGLDVAHKLVSFMGGTLEQKSTSGIGKIFAFDLRLPATQETLPTAVDSDLSGLRILATNELPSQRQWIREVLEMAGAEVELTSGGVELIRNLQEDPGYDCIILDVSLPDIDGIAAVSIIRSNPMLSSHPVVLTSSMAINKSWERLFREDINALLSQPISKEVLVQAVHKVVTSGHYTEDLQRIGDDRTVLVVEDNDVNLRLAHDLLVQAGYFVVSAKTGTQALRVLRERHVDAVLMDIQLPDISGLEATKQIRLEPRWSKLPIIAMTAHAMKGDAERFLDSGLDGYLSKPVNRQEMLRVLGQQISKSKRSESNKNSSLGPS